MPIDYWVPVILHSFHSVSLGWCEFSKICVNLQLIVKGQLDMKVLLD